MFAFIHKWHKKIGVTTAIFVIFLAVSGILLNHSQQLSLNSEYIQSEWLLDLYQINPEAEPFAYNINNIWIVQIGERLYFNEVEIMNDINQLKASL